MKKLKKLLCVLFSVMLTVCLFVGCNDYAGNGGTTEGEVTENEWRQVLSSFDVETLKNVTCEYKLTPTYSKEQAEEYGDWFKQNAVILMDIEKQIYYEYNHAENYYYEDDEMRVTYSKDYYFIDSGIYFDVMKSWNEGGQEPVGGWIKNDITQSDYILSTELLTNSVTSTFATLQMISESSMKANFTFNEDTKSYSGNVGGLEMSIKFLDNGITYTYSPASTMVVEWTYTNINKTILTIPDEVKALVTEELS